MTRRVRDRHTKEAHRIVTSLGVSRVSQALPPALKQVRQLSIMRAFTASKKKGKGEFNP